MAEQKKVGRPSMGKTRMLTVPVSEEAHARLKSEADKQSRSMNHMVRSLLDQALGIGGSGTPAPQEEEKPKRVRTGGRMSEGATAMLTISLQPELKEAVRRVARMEKRTASNMACLMLRDWILQYEHDHPEVEVWGGEEEAND